MYTIHLCTHTLPGPRALQGLRIGFVTDLHVARYRKPASLAPLLALFSENPVDLLLWGGDFAETAGYQRECFRRIAQLSPRLGMAAVIGNNDKECFGRSFPLLRDIARRAGVRLLINEEYTISVNGTRIRIAGLDEWKYGCANAKGMFKSPQDGELRILLTHYPHLADTFFAQAEAPPHLILSGHTHGGQIRFSGRTCYDFGYGKRYAQHAQRFFLSGYRTLEEQTRSGAPFATRMLVSNGAGESLLPLRLFCPRQMHIITIA